MNGNIAIAGAALGGTIALWDTKRGVQVGSLDVRRDAGGGRRAGDLLPASAAAEGAHFTALAYAPARTRAPRRAYNPPVISLF
jgi:hypothetical protein